MGHTSLKSKLAKNNFPEERTIYSESSRPGDFKNDLEIGLACNVMDSWPDALPKYKYFDFYIILAKTYK